MPSISQWDLSLPTEGDRLTRRNQISAFYDAGDWKSTYREARALLAAYPWSVDAHVTEAALLGDFAETFTGPDRDRRKAAAVRKLRYWVRTPPVKLPRSIDYRARNELYYHVGDWKRQTLLGRYRCKHGEPQAAYSVGVGAAFYATELMRRGQALGAGRWATEALSAWDLYFSTRPARNRFDTLTFHAVALAVLGRFDEAEEELKVVAGLIGKDIRETNIYDVADRLSWCRRGLKIR